MSKLRYALLAGLLVAGLSALAWAQQPVIISQPSGEPAPIATDVTAGDPVSGTGPQVMFEDTGGDARRPLVDLGGRIQVVDVNAIVSACNDPIKVTSVNVNMSAATGNVQVVALSAGQVIYVCGYNLIAGGAGDVTVVRGTGTNCGTGTTVMETLGFTADAGFGIANPNAGAVQMKTASGGALCLGRSASVTLKGRVTYVQQ